jgi:ArsR family transcriptional regulator
MPSERERHAVIHWVVTPRFEIFYALRALESGTGEALHDWRRDMERRLPDRLRTRLASVAPTSLMWPLLADALRESAPTISFDGMIQSLSRMDARSFQSFVLAGVFKKPGAVENLISGSASLARTVAAEAESQEKLLTLLGLLPFSRRSPAGAAFDRIVTNPGAFRDEVVGVLESFWQSGFSETWQRLEPQMKDRAHEMKTIAMRDSFASFAADNKLPVTMDGDQLVAVRGATHTPVASPAGVYLLPSAFNTARLWTSYADARGRTRFFLPVYDPTLSLSGPPAAEPALVFRALGDTTRYAIASSIARTPMTSVELARAFGVSKPTISHHVNVLRGAGLLEETTTESGVLLALNRRRLERASIAAAREMFADGDTSPVIKRSRRQKRSSND